MVLLAGDLFHDNKPSRKSMYQVMRSLRMNCLGEKPCELEMLSDANEVLNGDHVNYEDPDINVSIPVFSIHGNHDDPTGEGHFCSLDLLQMSGLLNYFGRIPETDKIEVKPVLLQKGQTKLALYGMSNVRDERLFRTFREGNVKFFKPGVQPKDWFNIMAVHQNHHAYSESGYLPENLLPELMDLVVWGHEHECLIDPRLNTKMQFHVMQPGSSVATSLVPGEAVPKHVAVVSVTGKEFTVEKHRIKSVRPFITKELVLAQDPRFRGIAKEKENRSKLTMKLKEVVDEMIEEAKSEWLEIQEEGDIEHDDDGEPIIPLPLVRLRVEYTAPEGGKFDCENPQRFSNRFVGHVANVNDVVHFYRKKSAGTRKGKVDKDMPEEGALAAAMAIDNVKVEKLVREFLVAQSLKILPRTHFGAAVTEFVDKDDKRAMENFVEESLSVQVKQLLTMEGGDTDIDSFMDEIRLREEDRWATGLVKKDARRYRPAPENWDSDELGAWEDDPAALCFGGDEGATAKPASKRGKGASLFSDDDDASVVSAPGTKKPAAKKAPAKKAPAKPRAPAKAKTPAKVPAKGRKKVVEISDEEDDVIMEDRSPPAAKPQPKRAATTKGRQSTLNFSQSQAKTQKELSDDEISEDDAFEPMASSSRRP